MEGTHSFKLIGSTPFNRARKEGMVCVRVWHPLKEKRESGTAYLLIPPRMIPPDIGDSIWEEKGSCEEQTDVLNACWSHICSNMLIHGPTRYLSSGVYMCTEAMKVLNDPTGKASSQGCDACLRDGKRCPEVREFFAH